MPSWVTRFVHGIESVNRWIGRGAMLLIFAMMGILLYSSVMKTVSIPPLWTLEMAQFVMVAYYMLGGPYSLQQDAHVRMDLAYSRWSPRTKAAVDGVTILFLIFFLGLLLYGGISSSTYALEYGERSYSAWRPYMAPIKILMTVAIFLMLLQAVAVFCRNVASARGEPLP
ncbi:MAG: TRAP transporter small permease subunit [Geminicoccaceae bacterium]